MSTPVFAAELEGNSDFQQELIAAILEVASDVRSVALSGSRTDLARAGFADLMTSDKTLALSRFGRVVALAIVDETGGFVPADVKPAVEAVWDTLAGIPNVTGALAIAGQAQSYDFQQRVYVIGARLASDILNSSPPAADAPASVKAIDGIKRVFAIRFQAGRFTGPQHQLNYAVNVLAPLTPAEAAAITDEDIYNRLSELTSLFAANQAALSAAGVNTGLLA